LHFRFPKTFTAPLLTSLLATLAPPSRASLAALSAEQRDKEESARIVRQRPALRVSSELALVGILRDGPNRSGAETIMKTLKDLVRRVTLPMCYHTNYFLRSSPMILHWRPCLCCRRFLNPIPGLFLGLMPHL